jgi:hypothetical protein
MRAYTKTQISIDGNSDIPLRTGLRGFGQGSGFWFQFRHEFGVSGGELKSGKLA